MPQEEKAFTPHDVMVLQEETMRRIDVIGEQYGSIQKKLTTIQEKVDKIDGIESDIVLLKVELEAIKDMLTHKADKEEHARLVARVQALEARHAPG